MKQASDMYSFSTKLWINKRSISDNGETTLYTQVVINGKHKEFNLKLRWPVDLIDLIGGRLLPKIKNDPDCNAFNIILTEQQAKHNEINRAFLLRNEPLDILKFQVQLSCFDDKENLAAFILKERQRRFNKREIELITYKNAGAVVKAVLKYDKEPKFNKIDDKWMRGFQSFLRRHEYKPGKFYKEASIWSFIKVVKTYLQVASDEPLIYVNPKSIEFSNPEPGIITTFLDREELRRLLILDNNGCLTDLQERVLKAFLFQCYTGLRISDIYRANNSWRLQENELCFLPHKNRKLGRWLKIPLMGPALSIIRKCTDKFFDLPNSQQYNETLKEVAAKAKINKKLHSHVGRHTFGFLLMTSVGNIYALQELLGHKTLKPTQRYAHLNDDYKRKALREMAESFNDYTI